RLALAVVGATAEMLACHGCHHVQCSLITLGLALWEGIEMLDFGRCEQHGSAIGAGIHAGSTTNACRRVEGCVRGFLRDQDGCRFRGAAGGGANVSPSLNDTVERGAIDDEVLDYGERLGAPRLDSEKIAILEEPHVQLAHRCAAPWPVRHSVDQEAAGPADALAAVVLERQRLLASNSQVLVKNVQHFKERHVGRNFLDWVLYELSRRMGVSLAPDSQCKVHSYL